MSSYVYQRAEAELWTVGFYEPKGGWVSESDHEVREAAAVRCHWLNGGNSTKATAEYLEPLVTTGGMAISADRLAEMHASMEADVISFPTDGGAPQPEA